MLPLVAWGFLSVQEATPSTPATVTKAMEDLGYTLKDHRPDQTWGQIAKNGADVSFSMMTGPSQSVIGLTLSIEIPVRDDLAPTLASSGFGPTTRFPETLFYRHLGKTGTVTKWIELTDGDSLRKGLDEFWHDGEAFAKEAHGRFEKAPVVDFEKKKFSDKVVLRVADSVSLERVTRSWGWTWKQGWGGSGPTWAFPNTVDGALVWLGGVTDPQLAGRAVQISTAISIPKTTNPQFWVEKTQESVDWAGISASSNDRVNFYAPIDLRKGVSLGDLRRRIQEFRRKAVAIEKAANSSGT